MLSLLSPVWGPAGGHRLSFPTLPASPTTPKTLWSGTGWTLTRRTHISELHSATEVQTSRRQMEQFDIFYKERFFLFCFLLQVWSFVIHHKRAFEGCRGVWNPSATLTGHTAFCVTSWAPPSSACVRHPSPRASPSARCTPVNTFLTHAATYTADAADTITATHTITRPGSLFFPHKQWVNQTYKPFVPVEDKRHAGGSALLRAALFEAVEQPDKAWECGTPWEIQTHTHTHGAENQPLGSSNLCVSWPAATPISSLH